MLKICAVFCDIDCLFYKWIAQGQSQLTVKSTVKVLGQLIKGTPGNILRRF